MTKIKKLYNLSKQLKDLDKKADKSFNAYEKEAMKAGCYLCKKRGNPIKVPFSKVHSECRNCKYASIIVPLHEANVKDRTELERFISDEYFPKAYEYLKNNNPMIKGPRGIMDLFLNIFKGSPEKFDYQTKEVIVYIIEDGSVYHIINS